MAGPAGEPGGTPGLGAGASGTHASRESLVNPELAVTGVGVQIDDAAAGSTHVPAMHTRAPLQSVSFVHWALTVADASEPPMTAASALKRSLLVRTSGRDIVSLSLAPLCLAWDKGFTFLFPA